MQSHQIRHQKEVTQVLKKYASTVNLFLEFLPRYKEYLYQCIRHFKAGCLSQYTSIWKDITSDQQALQVVQEMKLEFEESPFQVGCSRFEIPRNQSLIQEEANKLLKKELVVECEHKAVEYISPIFLREKSDGTQRLIPEKFKYLEYCISTLKCKHFRTF